MEALVNTIIRQDEWTEKLISNLSAHIEKSDFFKDFLPNKDKPSEDKDEPSIDE